MNIARHVERGHSLHGERTAISFEGRELSYADLDTSAGKFAAALHGLGITRGDRVALILSNSPEWVIAYIGALKLGAIVVSINPSLKNEELRFLLEDSGARIAISSAAVAASFARADVPAVEHWVLADGEVNDPVSVNSLIANARRSESALEMDRDDPAVIVYTSGTTGFPKGAVLSHGNVISNIEAKRRYLGIEGDDRMLLFLPLFHCFGQNAILNSALESGATVVLQRQFDEARVRHALVEERVTMFFGVPTTFLILCDAARVEEMRGVRYCFSAASSLPADVETRWEQKFGRLIYQGYGLTETSPFATYNHLTHHKRGSIGTPIEYVDLKVISVEDGSDAEPGKSGELVIRGPNVMLGYWQRPAETAEVLRDGWFRTGDIGRSDADGYFFIEDRLKDMVNVGGLKVFPAEVENVILQHPVVADVAVYGVTNALFGERVIAAVVAKTSQLTDGEVIRTFCRARLAEYKVPDEIEFTDKIPRNPTGKVLKRVLRDQYQQAVRETSSDHHRAKRVSLPESRRWITNWLNDNLQIAVSDVDPERSFFDFGLTSSQAMQLASDAGAWLGITFPATLAWRFPTLGQLAQRLTIPSAENESASATASATNSVSAGIAPEMDDGEGGADLNEFSMAEIADLLSKEISASKERKSR